MNNILEKIYQLSINNKKSLEQIGLKLSEEIGECCQALLSFLKSNGSEYKQLNSDDVKEECIDIIMVALSLFYKLGGEEKELIELLNIKTNKWKEKSK